jgi:hypothetical protein
MHAHDESHGGSFLTSRGGLVFLGFLAIAGFYLITEHTAHLFGVLPFLLLLACPLMHLFMHGGHGDEHEGGHQHGGDLTKRDGSEGDRR